MFIYFDPDKGAECDNCGTRGTIMHMSELRVDQRVDLCIACFVAVVEALNGAAEKLNIPMEMTRSRRRCWGERKRESGNIKIRTYAPSTALNHRASARRA
jgi:hypothetical protein